MIMMAAGAFHAGHSEVAEIGQAYATLIPIFGAAGGGHLPGLAHGLGHFELRRGHHGGSGDHAGLRRLAHSRVAPPPGDHAARVRCGGRWARMPREA